MLRERLQRPSATQVLSVGRAPLSQEDPKLATLIRADLFISSPIIVCKRLQSGYHRCPSCLITEGDRRSAG